MSSLGSVGSDPNDNILFFKYWIDVADQYQQHELDHLYMVGNCGKKMINTIS
jgi:hypothetical protein